MEKMLISIILPVFNGEKFLPKSIESCLNQTYKNFELIIVNDYSTDTTLEIATFYASNDDRIKIINNVENKKLPASLNIGHRAAIGDFITWTSDDNLFEINALEILLKNILTTEADVVYSNFNSINENGTKLREVNLKGIENIIFGNFIGTCFLYKMEVFDRNTGYNEEFFLIEDYDFWLKATLHSSFFHVKETLYNYRKHDQTLTYQIAFDETKNQLWKTNVAKMFNSFSKSISQENHLVLGELFTNSLIGQPVKFSWLKENEIVLKKFIESLSKNKNFKNILAIEKVFLKHFIGVLASNKNEFSNFSESLYILRRFKKVIDLNSIKTLIKLSILKNKK